MSRGILDRAKVYDDVSKLQGTEVKKAVMITAGFPCQDLSSANPKGTGLKGKRSGLVWEILRLVDELPKLQVLLLENSPNIVTRGMDKIITALKTRGWKVSWMIVKGTDVGAPLQRRRWVALAIKNLDSKTSRALQRLRVHNSWSKGETTSRFVSPESGSKLRCAQLGNAVVPACVVYATKYLLHVLHICPHPRRPNVPSPSVQVITDGHTTLHLRTWASPTAQKRHYYPCSFISHRSRTLLTNQLYYAISSYNEKMRETKEVNPEWIEWLMGYTNTYTECASPITRRTITRRTR